MKKLKLIILAICIIVSIPVISLADSSTEYRALLIANGNYYDGNNLQGPANDLIKVNSTMKNNYFGGDNKQFKSIIVKKDLTHSQMIASIKASFKDAKATDVSYLYYSGHGNYNTRTNSSNITGVDGKALDVHELEAVLSKIPGKIVIILDSCNSGGFINKSSKSAEKNSDYNDSVVRAFTNSKARAYLTKEKYKVITASSKSEYSFEYKYADGWGGGFTRAFVEGMGYKGKFLSDVNTDKNVSLSEIYNYTRKKVEGSSVQVYPNNDSFVIGSSFKEKKVENNIINWKTFDDIALDKVWAVNFNQKLKGSSWEDKVYILDSDKNIIKTNVSIMANGKSLMVEPLENYKASSQYSLWIQDNIYSETGNKHKDKVLVKFNTLAKAQEEPIKDIEGASLDMVKNGYFDGYANPNIRVLFENYFENPKWEYFKSDDALDIVEFTGDTWMNNQFGNFVIQFRVDLEGERFEIVYSAFEGGYSPYVFDPYELDSLLSAIYNAYNDQGVKRDLGEAISHPSNIEEKYKLLDKKIDRVK